jgi:hypothetical protein
MSNKSFLCSIVKSGNGSNAVDDVKGTVQRDLKGLSSEI